MTPDQAVDKWGAAGDKDTGDGDLQGALDKAKKTPPALATDSIAKLSQLRQEAELAARIEDFDVKLLQLQKRGQRSQGTLVAAERR